MKGNHCLSDTTSILKDTVNVQQTVQPKELLTKVNPMRLLLDRGHREMIRKAPGLPSTLHVPATRTPLGVLPASPHAL